MEEGEEEGEGEHEAIQSRDLETSGRGRRGRRWKRRRKYRRQQKQRLKPLQKSLFFNYTDIPLTEAMESVGSCGPGYVPDRVTTNPVDISVANLRMNRSMEWDGFFQMLEKKRSEEEGGEEEVEVAGDGEGAGQSEQRMLKDRDVKTNMPRSWRKPAALKEFQNANLLNLTSPANLVKTRSNFSPLQRAGLRDMNQLSEDRTWVIKPTDKSGGFGIMPFDAYNRAMKEKLEETFKDQEGNLQPKYVVSSKAELKREWKRIAELVEEGRRKGFVGEKDAEVANSPEPTPCRLYGNPKVHKPVREDLKIPPLREIVSCCGSNVEGLGKIVDFYCRPVDESCSSFIQDTPHLLRTIEELNSKGPQPAGTWIFSLDVVALYPSVPTSRGPEVQRKRLLMAGLNPELVDWLTRCTVALLTQNTFEYDGILYTQKDGAGIGQPQACSYAGNYMSNVEEEGLRKWGRRGGASVALAKGKGMTWRAGDRAEVGYWGRFRDDCLGLFRGTKAEFEMFFATMGSVDPAIRFTHEVDFENNSVNFLDVTIWIDAGGFIRTDLYTKPNTLNQLLSPDSAHPGFVTRSSVYSQALRYRRICWSDEVFEKRVLELQDRLLERGYSREVVVAGIQRAREVARSSALEKVKKVVRGEEEQEGRQHRLIVEYDRRSSPALKQVLKSNYEAACSRDSRFKAMFPTCPKPVFKRGTNVKQLLCKAKLPRIKVLNTRAAEKENARGLSRCNRGNGRNQCGACPYLTQRPNQIVKEVKINSSGETIKIMDKIDCKTKSFLYVLQSDKSPLQYAGQSGATVAQRTQQHAGDIDHLRLEKAVPKHFNDTGSWKENLVMTPFQVIKSRDPWIRLHYEREFINKHGLITQGINRML